MKRRYFFGAGAAAGLVVAGLVAAAGCAGAAVAAGMEIRYLVMIGAKSGWVRPYSVTLATKVSMPDRS